MKLVENQQVPKGSSYKVLNNTWSIEIKDPIKGTIVLSNDKPDLVLSYLCELFTRLEQEHNRNCIDIDESKLAFHAKRVCARNLKRQSKMCKECPFVDEVKKYLIEN